MDAKHTPLPWRVAISRDADGEFASGILGGRTWVVGNVERPFENIADAHFLVRAANSHSLLVEACRAALAELGNYSKPYNAAEGVCDELRAALAGAEPVEGRKLSTDPKYANWPPTLVPDAEDQPAELLPQPGDLDYGDQY